MGSSDVVMAGLAILSVLWHGRNTADWLNDPELTGGHGPFIIRMSLLRSILHGSIGFAVVSIAGFSIWALSASGTLPLRGEGLMYAASAAVFVILSGIVLHPLVRGERAFSRFHFVFVPAFILYAAVWSALWFALGMGRGEWLGSLAGSAVFAGVVCWFFKKPGAWLPGVLGLFLAHSAGYFIGGELFYPSDRQLPAKLLWGLCYGLGFGAGIGWVFWLAQRSPKKKIRIS